MLTDEQLKPVVERLNKVLQYAGLSGDEGAVLGSHILSIFLTDEGFEAWVKGEVNEETVNAALVRAESLGLEDPDATA